jgi:acetolactate synthase-1/2/3 large subunit
VSEPGPLARSLTDLSQPVIDWVALARGMGVPGVRVETTERLLAEIEASFAEAGPRLIEVVL